MPRHSLISRGIVTAALLCLLPAAVFAQNNGGPRMGYRPRHSQWRADCHLAAAKPHAPE